VPRRREVKKREVLPDPIFSSPLATRFINALMQDGRKSTAQGIFYGAMDLIKDRTSDDPLKVFKKAVDNVKPTVEVKSRRVGGATYQVPVEVATGRRLSLSIRWLIGFSKNRNERTMREKLAGEFMDASNYQGGAMRKKDDTHRMAEANKAFAHYRW
jgi:small subunit ribosomal protein S7